MPEKLSPGVETECPVRTVGGVTELSHSIVCVPVMTVLPGKCVFNKSLVV